MNNKFGEFLYNLRKEKGWTQSELAENFNLTNKAISKWETGEAFPETALLVPLATLFNITVDELLKGKRNDSDIVNPVTIESKSPNVLKPFTSKQVATISIAVGLLLLGVMLLIILQLNSFHFTIYVPQMLFCTTISVFMLISTGMQRELYSIELEEVEYRKGKKAIYILALGVSLLILSPIALIVSTRYEEGLKTAFPIFFAFLLAGIPLVIYNSMIWDALKKEKNIPTEETVHNYKLIEEAVCSIIMLTALGVFLALGFFKSLWHPSWAVFPLGGLLCAITSTILKGLSAKK